MAWVLKGGRVVDPASGIDDVMDVALEDGVVGAVGRDLPRGPRELDCRGMYVMPGFIDLGARLGEPGLEHRETIASGARAAAAGGFAAVCALPEADPVPDTPQSVGYLLARAAEKAPVRVYAAGALTRGGAGRDLTEIEGLRRAGATALAALEDVEDGGLLRRALQYAGMFDVPVLLRGDDRSLADRGVMHEGFCSTVQGLAGSPAAAEASSAARAVFLALETDVPVHLLGISAAVTVDFVRWAKQVGAPVTASVGASHLVFTDEDVRADDARWKTAPPFRSRKDREALRRGVADGTVDAIFSDHAPRSVEEKDTDFDAAPFGATSLETAAALVFGELVGSGLLTPSRAAACFSAAPAGILRVAGGRLQPGGPGDVTVVDPGADWVYEAREGFSRSRNTPVDGRRLGARPAALFVGGSLVMKNGRMIER